MVLVEFENTVEIKNFPPQVEKTFEYLVNYYDEKDCKVRFNIKCADNNSKGLVICNNKITDSSVSIEPVFADDKNIGEYTYLLNVFLIFLWLCSFYKHSVIFFSTNYRMFFLWSLDPQIKIDFMMNLVLTCDASWVCIPKYLALANSCRSFNVRIDPTSLPTGAHGTRYFVCEIRFICLAIALSNLMHFLGS